MKRLLKNVICLLCFAVMATGLPALAQDKVRITGTVTSSTDREPLVMVYVQEIDKDGRTLSNQVTDMNGVYSIMVNPASRLKFDYMGYNSQTVPINNRSVINIQMVEEAQMLDVVEVSTERKFNTGILNLNPSEITGSYARINASELEGIQTASIDEALQGRIAGVDIVATSGDPGVGMQIRIRGTTTLTGDNQPLIVVNGVPFETNIDPDFDFANADEEQYGALISVAPEDIEEITVLKDAAATAIWGNKAANGVLDIRTKRGKRGKPMINYTLKTSLAVESDPIPMLNGDQYTTLMMDMLNNQADGTPFDPVRYKEFNYDPNDPYYYYNFGQNTDWIGAVRQNTMSHDHNLSLTGGGEKASYRLGLGYLSQLGQTKGTGLDRLSTTLNLDYIVSEKIKFIADFSYTRSQQEANYLDPGTEAYKKMPNMSIYEWQQNDNGDWVQTPNFFIPQTIAGTTQWDASKLEGSFNPLAMAELGVSDVVEERLRPQFRLQYRIARWLSYEGTAAFDVNNRKDSRFLPQETVGGSFTGFVNISQNVEREQVGVSTYNKLVFTPNLGDIHSLTTLVQYEVNESKSRQTEVNSANSATSMLRDPAIPSRIRNSALETISNESKSRRAAALVQATYSLLDSRYVLSGTLRMDGNSNTAPDKQYKMFPAVSGRWNIGREPFMRGLKERLDIYNLSLRASWGYSGNAGSNSNLYNRYGSVPFEYLGTSGIIPSNIASVSQEWQKTYQSNFGFDMDIFDGRFTLGYEYYVKRTTNMSASQAIPAVSGFSSVSMNAGAMKNEGWEFQISTRLVKKTDFGVDVAFNISQNQNTITELSDRWDVAQGDMSRNGQYLQTLRLNNPVGSFYGYRYLGVYANEDQLWAKTKDGEPIYVPDGSGGWTQRMMTFYSSSRNYMFQPGDAIYADMNYDGNIDVQDIVYLGNSNPKYQGGGNFSIRYKQFHVNLYFNYRWGNDVWNKAKMNLERMENLENQSTAVLRRWRYPYADPADQPADILPRPVYGANNSFNYLGSDRFIEDASFIRLNSMNIRYDLPKNLLAKLKIRTAYLTFNMRNIMTFTDYTGQDPEQGSGGIPYGIASDNNRTPPTKSYQMTLSVGF